MLDYTDDKYKNTMTYQSKSDFNRFFIYKQGEVIHKNLTPKEFIEHGNKLLINEKLSSTASIESYLKNKGFIVEVIVDINEYNNNKSIYNKREYELHELWMRDLSEHYGVDFINDPIGAAIFGKAYERGHSAGIQEVDNILSDIIEFAENIIKNINKSNMAKAILK